MHQTVSNYSHFIKRSVSKYLCVCSAWVWNLNATNSSFTSTGQMESHHTVISFCKLSFIMHPSFVLNPEVGGHQDGLYISYAAYVIGTAALNAINELYSTSSYWCRSSLWPYSQWPCALSEMPLQMPNKNVRFLFIVFTKPLFSHVCRRTFLSVDSLILYDPTRCQYHISKTYIYRLLPSKLFWSIVCDSQDKTCSVACPL